jgi:DNA-binding CsgD family transcriptional regulator
MKIPDFTKPELDYIIKMANLTKREEELLWLRNNEHSLEECAEIMDYSISTIKRLNIRLKNKILKIL